LNQNESSLQVLKLLYVRTKKGIVQVISLFVVGSNLNLGTTDQPAAIRVFSSAKTLSISVCIKRTYQRVFREDKA